MAKLFKWSYPRSYLFWHFWAGFGYSSSLHWLISVTPQIKVAQSVERTGGRRLIWRKKVQRNNFKFFTRNEDIIIKKNKSQVKTENWAEWTTRRSTVFFCKHQAWILSGDDCGVSWSVQIEFLLIENLIYILHFASKKLSQALNQN